jgi:hypothetical protein
MRDLLLPAALLLPLATGVSRPGRSSLQAHPEGGISFVVNGSVEDKVDPPECATIKNPYAIDVSDACDETGSHCWPTSFIIGVQKAATTSVGNALHQCGLGAMAYGSESFGRCKADVVCKETLHAPLDIRTNEGRDNFTKLYSSAYCCNEKSDMPCPGPQPRRACETAHFISAQPLRVALRLAKTEYEPYAVALGGDNSGDLAPVDQFDDYDDPESSNNIVNVVNAMPRRLLPVVRFVLILREPVSRMLSWYNHELEDAGSSESKQARSDINGMSFDQYAHFQVAPRSTWTDYNGVSDVSNKSVTELALFRKVIMRRTNTTRFPNLNESLRGIPSLPYDQPAFSKGVYFQFLTFFKFHPLLSRQQLLVMNLDSLVDDPQSMMKRITSHFGMPILTNMKRLIKTNDRKTMDRVVQPRCITRDFLASAYAPFNAKLYGKLKMDRDGKRAPFQEPVFPEFDVTKSVPCTNGNKALLASDVADSDSSNSSKSGSSNAKGDSAAHAALMRKTRRLHERQKVDARYGFNNVGGID